MSEARKKGWSDKLAEGFFLMASDAMEMSKHLAETLTSHETTTTFFELLAARLEDAAS